MITGQPDAEPGGTDTSDVPPEGLARSRRATRQPLSRLRWALLTALAAVGRTYLSSGAGFVAKATGWPLFFVICVVVAVPSLILLAWLQRRGHFAELETSAVIAREGG